MFSESLSLESQNSMIFENLFSKSKTNTELIIRPHEKTSQIPLDTSFIEKGTEKKSLTKNLNQT